MIKLSRRQVILFIFDKNPNAEYSCQQITKFFLKRYKTDDFTARYLSASISSILRKLVVKGNLKYSEKLTKRSGHIYCLNTVDKP